MPGHLSPPWLQACIHWARPGSVLTQPSSEAAHMCSARRLPGVTCTCHTHVKATCDTRATPYLPLVEGAPVHVLQDGLVPVPGHTRCRYYV